MASRATGSSSGSTGPFQPSRRIARIDRRRIRRSTYPRPSLDGVTPSNEGRGYVLRRILRRSIRAMRLLGWNGPVLPELLPVARDAMAPSYPEVAAEYERISSYAYGEEEAFLATLRQGTTILDLAIAETRKAGRTTLP